MANTRDRSVVGSVLDRMIEDDTEVPAPVAMTGEGDDLVPLLLNVRRDLEHLLNSRRRCLACPSEYGELNSSVLEYGIPDFTGLNMSLPSEREQTRIAIERAIRQFEKRLKDVVVTVLPNEDRSDRRLRLRITGVLRMRPEPERVEFDSEVDPSTAAIGVTPVP